MNQTIPEVYGKWSFVAVIATVFAVAGLRPAGSQDPVVDDAAAQQVTGEALPDQQGENAEDEIEDPPYTPKTVSQLQKSLSAIQFKVTQNEETEPAFRNKYWDNKKDGLYRCIICGQALFKSETKFKSGTGWPSFYDPISADRIGVKLDFKLIYPRQEVHCSRCKAHLGHVFGDGPKDKTGKRYCLNSAALRFEETSDEPKSKSKAKTSAAKE
ncbi:peptide-methionine (R)-S-oxide reductase MsrB [Stieleria mannarensis]|uniref:peptide-methionine (R)-S-oxide reductase MsrB n=1 Tax=Stieleria mannarensis TaxID=2755585 RepID=UPI0015FF3758|nr:peptide-methionine (R)-S-oxide reductase MsrB [Rhodopirellula sp. JC639]